MIRENNIVPTDLYIDVGKKSYEDLGFMRYGYLSLASSLFSRKILENGRKVSRMRECLPN